MHSDEEFTSAIAANPADETLRLIYADWLDERNDPRAEWFRVEAEIEQFAGRGERNPALLQRRQELASEFDLSWLATVRRRFGDVEFDSPDDAWDWLSLRLTTETHKYLPRAEDFDSFEADYGVRLPGGYRSFASRFGAGHLGAWFRIAVPGAPYASWHNLDALNQESARVGPPGWVEEIHCGEVPANEVARVAAQVRRMVFFCSLEAEEYIGWDPEDVRNSESPEYGVYILPRLGPPVECAHSFEQFVFDICLGDRFPDYIPADRQVWAESRQEKLWLY